MSAGMSQRISLVVNGATREADAEVRVTLADFLRDQLGLTGTHLGCEHGVCGACTVLVDGAAVRSCLMLAVQARGHEVLTVEGLANGPELHPLQIAFAEEGAAQCGYCTPGYIMAAEGLLRKNANPSEDEIKTALGSNICRCTGYVKIIEAVQYASEKMRGVKAAA
jgi:carbon-monoxide dehydrogenase small subunit